jgi:ABC-2 type transport system ATP-binding protein
VAPRLVAAGATVQANGDGALMVSGLEPGAIGDIVFQAGVPVHELALQEASLEEAFMELTRDDVEFHAQQHTGAPAQ